MHFVSIDIYINAIMVMIEKNEEIFNENALNEDELLISRKRARHCMQVNLIAHMCAS